MIIAKASEILCNTMINKHHDQTKAMTDFQLNSTILCTKPIHTFHDTNLYMHHTVS